MAPPVAPPPSSAALPSAPTPQPTTIPRRASTLPCLLIVVSCVTTADLLLKRGALQSHASADNLLTTLGIAALASPFTLAGILFHLGGLAAWLYTLRTVPLTIAYCFTAVQQATIALGAWLWLGETISPARWVGIALVMTGVVFLVPSIIAAEEITDRAGGSRPDQSGTACPDQPVTSGGAGAPRGEGSDP